jgi:hypothetical protein
LLALFFTLRLSATSPGAFAMASTTVPASASLGPTSSRHFTPLTSLQAKQRRHAQLCWTQRAAIEGLGAPRGGTERGVTRRRSPCARALAGRARPCTHQNRMRCPGVCSSSTSSMAPMPASVSNCTAWLAACMIAAFSSTRWFQ